MLMYIFLPHYINMLHITIDKARNKFTKIIKKWNITSLHHQITILDHMQLYKCVRRIHHDSCNFVHWFTNSFADMLFITIFNKVQTGQNFQEIQESKLPKPMHITEF